MTLFQTSFNGRRMSLLMMVLLGLFVLTSSSIIHTEAADSSLVESTSQEEVFEPSSTINTNGGSIKDEDVADIIEIDSMKALVAERSSAASSTRLRTKKAKAVDDSFNIALGFTGSITQAQRQGFLDARARWQQIITKDMSSQICVAKGTVMCGYKFTSRTCIDDLFIGVQVKPMDGVGKIAGSAGPCSVDDTGKVRMGMMTFDSADANQLIADGIWEATILHEMGHVLGLGTLWDFYRIGTAPGVPAPFLYRGALGNKAHQEINGGEGSIVIEDLGGYGTARAHWKEAVYDSEVMTGYLEPKGKPMQIAAMTVEALADLGYIVDVSKADPYTVPYNFPPSTTNTPTSAPTPRRKRTLEEYETDEQVLVAEARRLEEQVAKGEKIPLINDVANVPIVWLNDVEGIEVKPKEGREGDFAREKTEFKAKHKKVKKAAAEKGE